jgi:hypothetical protein
MTCLTHPDLLGLLDGLLVETRPGFDTNAKPFVTGPSGSELRLANGEIRHTSGLIGGSRMKLNREQMACPDEPVDVEKLRGRLRITNCR